MDASAAGDVIERAGRALIGAVPAPAKVILLGSHAVGTADEQSDFDFLVIESEVSDRFAEMARLGRLLGRMLVPADVVVVSEREAHLRHSGLRCLPAAVFAVASREIPDASPDLYETFLWILVHRRPY